MDIKKVLFVVLLFTCCWWVNAQTSVDMLSIPYSMDFEESDSVELAQWHLNPGVNASRCADQWAVGEATHSSGHQALYISCDGGASTCFDSTKNVQYAYRDFVLPSRESGEEAQYVVSFDWRCLGTNDACLYAGIAPISSVGRDMQANPVSGVVPTSIATWCTGGPRTLGPLRGSTLWKHASIEVSSGRSVRLFFVWTSTNADRHLPLPLGGCIDNIQINSKECPRPTTLTATASCDSVWVEWTGTSESYCLEYRKRGKTRWTVFSGIHAESKVLEGLEEGMYDMRVRGVCNNMDTSAYTYLNSFIIFCPEKHCINYVNLTDSNTVMCTYGTFQNPAMNIGVVDYGAEDKFSRHTVNWEPDQYDPRTCNMLPTIPDGELASVRLGNWNINAQGESVSFFYTADLENSAILLLKYAIVMEDPAHGATSQPRFQLRILNEMGELVSPTCGVADFFAGQVKDTLGWHTCGAAPGASSPVRWKEWTTIGLNLQEAGVRDGEVLTIQLITKDCSASAHFGYAYFTLGCANAKLEGTSCGSEPKLKVSAPNGFNYAWYDKYDNFVTDEQVLSVEPSDTTTYRCTLTYQENADCSFDLYASARPRFPIAEFTYRYEPTNCENRVRFRNGSHIMTMFDGDTIHHYDEPCDSYEWDYGTGDIGAENNPIYVFPQEGGTFPVTLYASISEGACVEDTTIYITLPALGDTLISRDTSFCDGSYIVFGQRYIGIAGTYRDTLTSIAGCDSIREINVSVIDTSITGMPDTTICKGQILEIGGRIYPHNVSGPFSRFFRNRLGCDSVVVCQVTVLDSILPIVNMVDVEDGRANTGKFYVSGSGFERFTMTHDGVTTEYTIDQDSIVGLNGGLFTFEFFNELNCSAIESRQMSYPCKQLIFQRWDDVLSVYNSELLGGMLFSSFQWIKNDVDIPGANLSYYYAPEKLDTTATYAVRVTTMNDSVFTSCGCKPSIENAPARRMINKRIDNQRLVIEVDNVLYNAQGIRIKEED